MSEKTPSGSAEPRLPMRRPLIALAVAYGLGILCAGRIQLPAWLLVAFSLSALGIAAATSLLGKGRALRFLAWLAVVFGAGLLRPAERLPVPAAPSGPVLAVGAARAGWQRAGAHRRVEIDLDAYRPLGGGWTALRDGTGLRLSVRSPEACPEILPGDRVRVFGRVRDLYARRNFGVECAVDRLRRAGIDYTASVEDCRSLAVEDRGVIPSLGRLAEGLRLDLQALIEAQEASVEARSVFIALTTGDGGSIPAELRSAFQRVGLAHLLAISGLHLGFVAMAVFAALVFVGVRIERLALRWDVRTIAACVAVPVVLFYTLLAGARLPSVRACAMVMCFLLAVLLRRRVDPLNTLAAAGLLILVLWPESLFAASFQLSFAAVASVLLLAPILAQRLHLPWRPDGRSRSLGRRLAVRAGQLLVVTLAASLGTGPLLAWHFQRFSALGLLSNLVAVPLTTWVIVPLGLASALVLPVCETLAGWLVWAGLGASEWLVGLAEWAAAIPLASAVSAPAGWQVLLFYLTLASAVLVARRRWAARAAFVGAALLVASWVAGVVSSRLSENLTVCALDVGQGDAILVRMPHGHCGLVDGGGSYSGDFDVGRHVVAPALWAQGISQLDWVAVTHRHPDHIGGLASVVRLFRPAELWTASPLGDDERGRDLLRAAQEAGTRLRHVAAGDRLLVDGQLRIDAFWPPAEGAEALEENERSMVLRLVFGQQRFLLTGDLEAEGELQLLRSSAELAADVLKVGHHGSRNASSRAFLERVHPSLAVVSVGPDNRFRLPSPEALARLASSGARVLRTDIAGAVCIRTDGESLEVEAVGEDDRAR
ncbi:MAG: DNA internalization-related competence protein ComEC/Rec2 [Deltaproteobacteria bacterium]|nr:DNA internalization-related competence protein ComEC/Rec2 [Deltaproteobacteria bacterium]